MLNVEQIRAVFDTTNTTGQLNPTKDKFKLITKIKTNDTDRKEIPFTTKRDNLNNDELDAILNYTKKSSIPHLGSDSVRFEILVH